MYMFYVFSRELDNHMIATGVFKTDARQTVTLFYFHILHQLTLYLDSLCIDFDDSLLLISVNPG